MPDRKSILSIEAIACSPLEFVWTNMLALVRRITLAPHGDQTVATALSA